jgi:hypothetical protein
MEIFMYFLKILKNNCLSFLGNYDQILQFSIVLLDERRNLIPEYFLSDVSDSLEDKSTLVEQKGAAVRICGLFNGVFMEDDVNGCVIDSPFAREANNLLVSVDFH